MTKNSPPLVSPSSVAPSSQFASSQRGFSISLAPALEDPNAASNGDLKTPTRPLKSPDGSFNAEELFINGRTIRENMIQSDTERETAIEDGIDTGTNTESRPNPKKRLSADAIVYPRRRATIAV